jgi:hypothetical protein
VIATIGTEKPGRDRILVLNDGTIERREKAIRSTKPRREIHQFSASLSFK